MKTKSGFPEIVKRALLETVTDIGQITPDERVCLNRYVKKGLLSKGKGGGFPLAKTVYAVSGFDFVTDRLAQLSDMARQCRMAGQPLLQLEAILEKANAHAHPQ